MKSRELDVAAAAPAGGYVEPFPDRSKPARTFSSEVFVVEWEVAADRPATVAPRDGSWRDEVVPMSAEGT